MGEGGGGGVGGGRGRGKGEQGSELGRSRREDVTGGRPCVVGNMGNMVGNRVYCMGVLYGWVRGY